MEEFDSPPIIPHTRSSKTNETGLILQPRTTARSAQRAGKQIYVLFTEYCLVTHQVFVKSDCIHLSDLLHRDWISGRCLQKQVTYFISSPGYSCVAAEGIRNPLCCDCSLHKHHYCKKNRQLPLWTFFFQIITVSLVEIRCFLSSSTHESITPPQRTIYYQK